MKISKMLLIPFLLILSVMAIFAQEEQENKDNEKIAWWANEFIESAKKCNDGPWSPSEPSDPDYYTMTAFQWEQAFRVKDLDGKMSFAICFDEKNRESLYCDDNGMLLLYVAHTMDRSCKNGHGNTIYRFDPKRTAWIQEPAIKKILEKRYQ